MIITENQNIVLGGPGSGKTSYLIDTIKRFIDSGISPKDIAFVSFTRKAIEESITRLGLKKNELPYFRTLHSLAFSQTGVTRDRMVNTHHFKEISKITNIKLSSKADSLGKDAYLEGDKILFLYSTAKLNGVDLKEYILSKKENISWSRVEYLTTFYDTFKKEYDLKDFTDLLVDYEKTVVSLPIKCAIIDEAQDLSRIQWNICSKAFDKVKHLYIAGDDDQAIYNWAGADVNLFLSLEGKKHILEKSHRIPKSVYELSQKIVVKLKDRFDKDYSCKEDEGLIVRHNSLKSVDFSKNDWLILGRNQYHLSIIEKELMEKGLFYNYRKNNSIKKEVLFAIDRCKDLLDGKSINLNDANSIRRLQGLNNVTANNSYSAADLGIREDFIDSFMTLSVFYRRYLKKAAALLHSESNPNIKISTIHGSKGGESDNVLLLTDVTRASMNDIDDLHRAFFVAITRTKKELHILNPQTRFFYKI